MKSGEIFTKLCNSERPKSLRKMQQINKKILLRLSWRGLRLAWRPHRARWARHHSKVYLESIIFEID
jgi:hypothetical protein